VSSSTTYLRVHGATVGATGLAVVTGDHAFVFTSGHSAGVAAHQTFFALTSVGATGLSEPGQGQTFAGSIRRTAELVAWTEECSVA
jgi:hypothetical protein